MPRKRPSGAGESSPAPPDIEQDTIPVQDIKENTIPVTQEEPKAMPIYETRSPMQPGQTPPEGITVVGEAVRRVSPESAEFLVEITASAPTAAQALRDNHLKTTQALQAVATAGVQPSDLQTISLNVYSLFAPVLQALPGYAAMPQIGQAGFAPYSGGTAANSGAQNEIQFGSYQARNTLRIHVRDAVRVGEIVDALAKVGATVASAFSFRAADEAQARRAALEAAGKDARAKAEALASATGRQIGDATSITEEVVATNGAYAALRAALPYSFGAGAPQVAGELEYYARVSANFRLA
jgi:uncharacterized protein YggE